MHIEYAQSDSGIVRYTDDPDKLTQLATDGKLSCLICKNKLLFVRGHVNRSHFKHYPDQSCTPGSTQSTHAKLAAASALAECKIRVQYKCNACTNVLFDTSECTSTTETRGVHDKDVVFERKGRVVCAVAASGSDNPHPIMSIQRVGGVDNVTAIDVPATTAVDALKSKVLMLCVSVDECSRCKKRRAGKEKHERELKNPGPGICPLRNVKPRPCTFA